jgi:hypothetical protein
LPEAQSRQVSVRIGKRWGEAKCGREGLGRLAVFVSEAEYHALIGPEDGVVFLGRDGPANDLLGQIEVTVVGGFPRLLCQHARTPAVFRFLFLGVHAVFLCAQPRTVSQTWITASGPLDDELV